MIHTLTVLLLVWFAGAAGAADDVPWFEIELIAFKHTAPEGTADEQWPADPGMPALHDAIVLRPPATSTAAPEAAVDASTDTTAQTPAVATDAPQPFKRLDDTALQLTAIARALRRSTAYAPLLHVGWRQAGNVKDGKIYLSSGTGEHKTLEGTAELNLGRYLHLAIDLVLRPAEPSDVTAYRLTESRRMRSQELHYFDHPKFGVIARITPYEVPKSDQIPPGAAPPAPQPPPVTAPAEATTPR